MSSEAPEGVDRDCRRPDLEALPLAAISLIAIPPGRYQELVRRVLDRLPEGWDYYRTVSVELSEEKPARGYASARRFEEGEGEGVSLIDGHHEQEWLVTLYRPWLEASSDDAAQWIIAHELGHVAAGSPCGSLVIGGRPHTRIAGTDDEYREITPEERDAGDKVADAIARAWGFWLEEEAFEDECRRMSE